MALPLIFWNLIIVSTLIVGTKVILNQYHLTCNINSMQLALFQWLLAIWEENVPICSHESFFDLCSIYNRERRTCCTCRHSGMLCRRLTSTEVDYLIFSHTWCRLVKCYNRLLIFVGTKWNDTWKRVMLIN